MIRPLQLLYDVNRYKRHKSRACPIRGRVFNATCKPFDSVGFLFDNTNCKNMTTKLEAAQANEYSLLNMGVVEDVDATMKKQLDIWNEAGLQDVLAEYNKQYEAWKALK